MSGSNYIWQKSYTALTILIEGSGNFEQRFQDAYFSHFIRLKGEAAPPELEESLNWVSDFFETHTNAETIELFDRREFTEKLIKLVIESEKLK